MKKEDIKSKITRFINQLEMGNAEVNIMLVDQNNQRKKHYRGLMLKTEFKDVQKVISDSFSFLIDELDRRTLDIYDLEISVDDSAQMVKKDEVIHGEEILEEITLNYTENNTVSESTDLSRIKFMVMQIYDNEENASIYLFKKYIQPSTAYKTSQKYTFSGGVLKPFTDEIMVLP